MNKYDITAMDLHGALSTMLFAIDQELGPLGYPRLSYTRDLYLQVHVECLFKQAEEVSARLSHGVLWGPFDYRFRCIGRPLGCDPDDRIEVSAMVDLINSKAPSGPIEFNNTPEEQRRRQLEYSWGWRRATSG